jgi:hypothetical protein
MAEDFREQSEYADEAQSVHGSAMCNAHKQTVFHQYEYEGGFQALHGAWMHSDIRHIQMVSHQSVRGNGSVG